jgi:hypothetical protein
MVEYNRKRKSMELIEGQQGQQSEDIPDLNILEDTVDTTFFNVVNNINDFVPVGEMLLGIESHKIEDDGWVFECFFTNKTKSVNIHERYLKNQHLEHVMFYLKKKLQQ